ncbi:hypothetical protein JVX90_13745 [Gordonia sp. PDNC005]|uniref:Gp19/Gp15/Gp42 family protein n=1 Tax=Gordonia sp. PDNC005 TaxID=2811424 RepID=UPI001963151A|nr:Gp19/Gp15/Gp42 family protein [Gordonia sp. PDNC005]QRY61475.1 hypothetical protein JVX90_13745 [Gordonia sp. PDNC005]
MADFATTTDLVDRWRPMDTTELSRAAVLLGDASEMLANRYPALAAAGAGAARMVVCAMVRRAMSVDDDEAGVASTTASETALGFSHSTTRQVANPDGALYISSADTQKIEDALGLNRGAISMTMLGA